MLLDAGTGAFSLVKRTVRRLEWGTIPPRRSRRTDEPVQKRFPEDARLRRAGRRLQGLRPAVPSARSRRGRRAAKKLKITDVEIFLFDVPLISPFRIAIGEMTAANDLLIRIRTDQGVFGVGEACPFPPITGETQATNAAAAKAIRDMIIGKDPLAIDDLLRLIGAHRPLQPEHRRRLRHGPLRHPRQGRRASALQAPRRHEERLRDRHHDRPRHTREA